MTEESEEGDGMPLAIPEGSVRACLLAMEDLIRLAYSDGGEQVGYDANRKGDRRRGGAAGRGRGRGEVDAGGNGVAAGAPAGGGRGNNGLLGACTCPGACLRSCPCRNNNPWRACCATCGCRVPGHALCKNVNV